MKKLKKFVTTLFCRTTLQKNANRSPLGWNENELGYNLNILKISKKGKYMNYYKC